jgi:hypothetical protein
MSRTIEYERFECANCHSWLSAKTPALMEDIIPNCQKCGKNWWVPFPLTYVDERKTEGKYIDFRLHALSPSGKTKTWVVQNRDNSTVLGRISYFGRWRKYVFEPYENMVFEETCLRDIAMFCQQESTLQRKAAATKRKAAKA